MTNEGCPRPQGQHDLCLFRHPIQPVSGKVGMGSPGGTGQYCSSQARRTFGSLACIASAHSCGASTLHAVRRLWSSRQSASRAGCCAARLSRHRALKSAWRASGQTSQAQGPVALCEYLTRLVVHSASSSACCTASTLRDGSYMPCPSRTTIVIRRGTLTVLVVASRR